MANLNYRFGACLAVVVLAWAGAIATAEEIWLHDNSRVYGLVKGVSTDNALTVLLPVGTEQKLALEDIIAIRFLGRNPLLVQSGTQEFRFINGGSLRGQIQSNTGDIAQLHTAMAGPVDVNLAHVKGFVALPLAGFSGRKAEELVEGSRDDLGRWVSSGLVAPAGEDQVAAPPPKLSKSLDVVLDNKGSTYPGVVRKLKKTELYLDHEKLLQVVEIRILYVAGVRLADAARDAYRPWQGDVQVRLKGRDESIVQGHVNKVHLGKWQFKPLWDPKATLDVDVEEIAQAQVLGGRVQYLSQLTPVSVKEQTVLSPPQPYRMDRSCQGDTMSIASKRYPWGVGVHANSELTFALNGRFREFRSDIGVATRMGARGSVVFTVLGDGRELYRSPTVRGSQEKPIEVVVPVAGVKLLTLKVDDAGDLDLGDVANWGSARVLR